jgi:3-phenylpropionate/trans-cinnamate dioxygenase ferredoxin reductase subunit
VTDAQSRVVIVGAGQAGGWVAATLRTLQPEREVVLIGDEPYPPYERPPLSKAVLMGEAAAESCYLKPAAFYADNNIELRLGVSVRSIDRDARNLRLSDGSTLRYGVLVVATGMRARALSVPGADHPRVVTLRQLNDVEAVRAGFGPGRRVALIGAGFIGLEIAAAARTSGAEVTVIETAPAALGRVVAPDVADALVARHRAKGVTFRFGDGVTAIEDDRGQPEMLLADGSRLSADVVVAGIGGVPNDEIARDAGLACDDGVLVDAAGRTSDPRIYAVGDVCRQHHPFLGRHVRLESWQNAQNGGIALGRHLAGETPEEAGPPWFWTDQYGDNFQIVGLPDTWDKTLWRGAPGDAAFTVIYLKNGRVVAGNTLNAPRDIRPLGQMIRNGMILPENDLADTSLSLVKLLKLQAAQ